MNYKNYVQKVDAILLRDEYRKKRQKLRKPLDINELDEAKCRKIFPEAYRNKIVFLPHGYIAQTAEFRDGQAFYKIYKPDCDYS